MVFGLETPLNLRSRGVPRPTTITRVFLLLPLKILIKHLSWLFSDQLLWRPYQDYPMSLDGCHHLIYQREERILHIQTEWHREVWLN
jgi:hypothetical protein